MSPHTALRLAVRPLRGATLLDHLATLSSTRTSFSPLRGHSRPSPCRPFSSLPPSSSKPPDSSSPPIILPPPPGSTLAPEPTPADDAAPSSPTDTPSPTETSPPTHDKTATTEPPPTPDTPELPSTTEHRRSPLAARFSTFMDDLQTRVLNATQTINSLTGYTAIETIKAANEALEAAHTASQARLHAARQAYKSLTTHRAATQREVTTLLARKDSWSPPDLERFTTLYRADHELEAQVAAASAELTEAEADEGRLSAELNAGILKRYHEEQIWSDRIRRQSTWGTWGLMGVNVLLFLGLQFVAEPWRRKRLVKSIAEGERGVLEEVREELGRVREALDRKEVLDRVGVKGEVLAVEQPTAAAVEEPKAVAAEEAVPMTQTPPEPIETEPFLRAPWKEVLADPALIKAAAADLCSERRIDVRMRDISLLALEGAAAGAAVMGGLVFALLRPR